MRIPLLLYGLALAVRVVLIWHFPDPAYPDSFYYVDVARALPAGQGFNVDFIWIFPEVGGAIPADPVLPIPSNAHWMPLASLVQVPFIALLGAHGVGLRAAVRADRLDRRTADLGDRPRRRGALDRRRRRRGPRRRPGPAAVYMTQPDNFSLYQPLVVGALWMGARGLRGLAAVLRARRPAGRPRHAVAQ